MGVLDGVVSVMAEVVTQSFIEFSLEVNHFFTIFGVGAVNEICLIQTFTREAVH